ncbi:MAG: NnrU family protein [Myxococcota bacterium]
MDPNLVIAGWSIAFVLTHVLPSHPPVRARLVGALGRRGYLVGYSVVSLVTWIPLVYAWWTHPHAGTMWWWPRSPAIVVPMMAVAAIGIAMSVAGFATPAPSAGAAPVRDRYDVRGIQAITRHPAMFGLGLVSIAHLVLNGFTSDLWFWGAHAVVAVAGAAHQDLRHRASKPGYEAYTQVTTFWPNPLGLARIDRRGWLGLGAGLALAIGIRAIH